MRVWPIIIWLTLFLILLELQDIADLLRAAG